MLIVNDLLKSKGSDIWTIGPETTTLDALRLLASKKIGALLVLDGGIIVGIISERDFVYQIANDRNCDLSTPVSEYMTTKVYMVTPQTSIPECMALMTDKRIRHLPVVSEGNLAGLISIGDVVKGIISEQEFTIQNLENYIVGGRSGH